MILLDCTFRDGGYYNDWNFAPDLVADYLSAMQAAEVEVIELGFRSIKNVGFKGACAFTTDSFLNSLTLPPGIAISVMVNASDLLGSEPLQQVLEKLFPVPASQSTVNLVRIACHVHEFQRALPAVTWLKDQGYQVGFNLMQIADRRRDEVESIALQASAYPLDVLYFADSMGGMTPDDVSQIIGWLRSHWSGPLGIHTHDNMGLGLQNTLRAMDEGATWVDSTVTGMGRGPGNTRTEELLIEIAERQKKPRNLIPLMSLIRKYFRPMQQQYGWGTNPYYYLAGKYGIHPTYIQEVLSDSRFDEADIFAVIGHLRSEGGKKFSPTTLDAALFFYRGDPLGQWNSTALFKNREVFLLGTGPGASSHRTAIENYIREKKPVVLALNTLSAVSPDLIDARVACHPVRLLADCETHCQLPQPLITPYSMLPEDVSEMLRTKQIFDFGLSVQPGRFEFSESHCLLPSSLVVGYALAVATSGQASRILMAGFDGYGADDPRTVEMQNLLDEYLNCGSARELLSVTPTRYSLPTRSIYATDI